MLEEEVVNLVEKVHPTFAVAVFVASVDAVVLVGINHQVKLLAVAKGVKSFKDGVNGVEEPEIKADKEKENKE